MSARLPAVRAILAALVVAFLAAGCGGIVVTFPGYRDERYPACPPTARVPDADCYGGPP